MIVVLRLTPGDIPEMPLQVRAREGTPVVYRNNNLLLAYKEQIIYQSQTGALFINVPLQEGDWIKVFQDQEEFHFRWPWPPSPDTPSDQLTSTHRRWKRP